MNRRKLTLKEEMHAEQYKKWLNRICSQAVDSGNENILCIEILTIEIKLLAYVECIGAIEGGRVGSLGVIESLKNLPMFVDEFKSARQNAKS